MAWDSMYAGLDFFLVLGTLGEGAVVIGRDDFDELGRDFRPLGEDFFGHHGIGELAVLLDEVEQLGSVVGGGDLFQLDDAEVAATDEIAGGVPDIRNAAAHAGGKIAAGGAED